MTGAPPLGYCFRCQAAGAWLDERTKMTIDAEIRELAQQFGITDQTLIELEIAGRMMARRRRVETLKKQALRRAEQKEAAVSRGQFQQSTRRGGVCPRCFMEMPVSGECDC